MKNQTVCHFSQVAEVVSQCLHQLRGKHHCDIFYKISIVLKLPAMGCTGRHQYDVAILERLLCIANSSPSFTFYYIGQLPSILLMNPHLLACLQDNMVKLNFLSCILGCVRFLYHFTYNSFQLQIYDKYLK